MLSKGLYEKVEEGGVGGLQSRPICSSHIGRAICFVHAYVSILPRRSLASSDYINAPYLAHLRLVVKKYGTPTLMLNLQRFFF